MAEIKKDAPKMEQSRWKITNLGGNHLFIHDPDWKQPDPGYHTNEYISKFGYPEPEKPKGWIISDSDAAKKFKLVTHPVKVGNNISYVPDKKYDDDDIALSNQVMSYLASKHSTAPKTENGAPVDKPKRGRPATGRKNYDHAAYQQAYRDRLKQKKIEAEKAKKAGI